jgi:hypothetical protein
VSRGKDAFDVDARELDGGERNRAWDLVVEQFPLYASYQRKTTRLIPLFALSRR